MIFNTIYGVRKMTEVVIDFADMRSDSSDKFCIGYYDANGDEVEFPTTVDLVETKPYYSPSDFGWQARLVDSKPVNAKYLEYPNSGWDFNLDSFRGNMTLESLCIPDEREIAYFPDLCFANCSNLRSIHISDKATWISWGAFNGCSSLTSFKFPRDLEDLIQDSVFANCTSLKEVLINNKINSLPSSLFANCGLLGITIPNNVQTIGVSIFINCASLRSVKLSTNISNLPNSCFKNCSALQKLEQNGAIITGIGQQAFYGCGELKNCPDLSNVTTMGVSAFEGCSSMVGEVSMLSITSIPNSAFKNCSMIDRITLNGSITSIGDDAFNGCSSAQGLEIPTSVTSIGARAFKDCLQKAEIVVPYGVTQIKAGTFSGCNYVVAITLPDSVTTIDSNALASAEIENVNIPASVTSMAEQALIEVKTSQITMQGSTPPTLGNNAFNLTYLTKIRVPQGSLSAYTSASSWSSYISLLEEY